MRAHKINEPKSFFVLLRLAKVCLEHEIYLFEKNLRKALIQGFYKGYVL